MLIDQRGGNLREGENFWIGTLLTNQGGLHNHHDFVQKWGRNCYSFILINLVIYSITLVYN